VLEVHPEAAGIAQARVRERGAVKVRGQLHGLPELLQDNIDPGDRMQTTAGALALDGYPTRTDATLVARLREAGAVILGKTNLSEWANFRSSNSSSGWSGRGGQCRNPYVLDRNPCGSSSGSGVAVSANLCAVAVGTETDGSIVCPANANGIVGIKPTVGWVSRTGVIPISHSQDTAGPMARTVADAALLLMAMSGEDRDDPATGRAPAMPDLSASLVPGGLKGIRIGVVRQAFGFDDRVDTIMEQALTLLSAGGAVLLDPTDMPTWGKAGDDEYEVLLYEFKSDLNAYLARRGHPAIHTLDDVIGFNERNADREMPWFGQDIFLKANAKGPLSEKAYLDARANCVRLSRTEGIDAALKKGQLDLLVAPTGGPAWVTDLVNGDHFSGGSSSMPAIAGYPAVTVPVGMVHGLPVGISFFGAAWSEPVLVKAAYAFEQASRARRVPAFQATVTR
jgi:amidase